MTSTTEPVIAKSNPVESDSTTLRKRRGILLIVDDEDGPRQSLRVIFKDEYDILMAEDGPTAIDLAQKHPVDVAVLEHAGAVVFRGQPITVVQEVGDAARGGVGLLEPPERVVGQALDVRPRAHCRH